ncbi:hypothetical protein DDB_G0286139 [Dictyostelium discoideum AX4]|uniref:Uncharacterized protein n=1 Tax=Dictyostelium discoideum TaxID=44689 RepID=Q54M78_DICDI|nr:hypothetical protein DDB_G0286139 [Dictyostelium discoideum AX4]EAL64362.1 hypothetical protein DDB_G0286139 [Dictyostelium discoideum AX4]|eukprot:XP_637870.1 hypothetical protein DDB_G0286139 [Dictyostelium discoideum AX4]
MYYNFILLVIKYYSIVWFLTFLFKYGKRIIISDNHSNFSYKILFFKIDLVISLIPFISLVWVLLNSYPNILLFIKIILENKFQFPDTLWVLFPIIYCLSGILLQYYRFKTIKRNSIKTNVYKEINGVEQLYYQDVQLYSYGSEFNKIKFTILTLLWIVLGNLEISNYINCNEINKYNNVSPGLMNFCSDYMYSTDGTYFEIVCITSQLLPYIFLIPLMEISMIV